MLNDEQFKLLRAKADIYGLSESSWKRAECATDLLNFVNALLAAERERAIEECAAVCESRAQKLHIEAEAYLDVTDDQTADELDMCAAAIRALKGKQ